MSMETYKIIRFYQDDDQCAQVMERGLTLDEARLHCADKETSSSTCMLPENIEHTEQYGAWFDGYDEE